MMIGSGYLIIYNIFLIAVTSDIHYYGLLKTVGMANRQLKALVLRQPVEGTADDAALACYQVGEKIPVFLPAATLIPRLMIKQAF